MAKNKNLQKRHKNRSITLTLISISLLAIIVFTLTNTQEKNAQQASYPQTEKLSMTLMPEIQLKTQYRALISQPKTGTCGALAYISDDKNLVGSCCGEMRLERYIKQRSYLARYSNIEDIPKDPWNVPAKQARELINYGMRVKLSPEEKKVYERAFELFEEGPCCCKCWRWFAFDGLAKKMIKEQSMNAEEIAKLWAAEDVCGDEDPFEEIDEK